MKYSTVEDIRNLLGCEYYKWGLVIEESRNGVESMCESVSIGGKV